jgi:hypothetical protein
VHLYIQEVPCPWYLKKNKAILSLFEAPIKKKIMKDRFQDPTLTFTEVIAFIDQKYEFSPTFFKNGDVLNEAGQNNGSCKVLAFAQMHNLPADQTLNLFGDYYRIDVLLYPDGTDHQNIRNFIKHGWAGVSFASAPLSPRLS